MTKHPKKTTETAPAEPERHEPEFLYDWDPDDPIVQAIYPASTPMCACGHRRARHWHPGGACLLCDCEGFSA